MSSGDDVNVSALRQKWALIERLGRAAHVTLAALRTSVALAPFDEDARSMSLEEREETATTLRAISAQAESARAQVNVFIEGVLRHSQLFTLRLQDAGDAKGIRSEQQFAKSHASIRREEDFPMEVDNLDVPAKARVESRLQKATHQLSTKSPQEPKLNNARRAYVDSLLNLENGEGMTVMGLSLRQEGGPTVREQERSEERSREPTRVSRVEGAEPKIERETGDRHFGSGAKAQPREYTPERPGLMSDRGEEAVKMRRDESDTEYERPLAPPSPAPASPLHPLDSGTREWNCVKCTLANQISTDTCAACLTPRLGGRGAMGMGEAGARGRGRGIWGLEAPRARRERVGGRGGPKGGLGVPEASVWTCQVCTLINTGGGHVCAACGSIQGRALSEIEQRRRALRLEELEAGGGSGGEDLDFSDKLTNPKKRAGGGRGVVEAERPVGGGWGSGGAGDGSAGSGRSEMKTSDHRISAVLAAIVGKVKTDAGREGEDEDEVFSDAPSQAFSLSSVDGTDPKSVAGLGGMGGT